MNEIDYTKDKKGIEKLDEVAKRMFHLNILYQNNMDSLVPNTFGLLSDIATDTWLSYLYSRIATEEQIHCLWEEDEILTSTGWKKLRDLTPTDKVANWWLQPGEKEGKITFETPISIEKQFYSGDMVKWSNREFFYFVTPRHRVVFYTPTDGEKIEWHTEEAFRCSLKNAHLPVCGVKVEGEKRELTPIEKLGIAFQLDGEFLPPLEGESTPPKSRWGYGYQFRLKDPQKVEKLREILKEMGCKYREEKEGEEKIFTLWVKEKWEKGFNWIELEKITAQWGQEFLRELKKWDNFGDPSHPYIRFISKDKKAVEKVMAVATLSGYQVKVEEAPPPPKRAKRGRKSWQLKESPGIWKLRFIPRPTKSAGKMKKELIFFTGNIVGVEVPSTYIIVRFGGQHIAVTGNSLSYSNGLFQVFGEKVGEMLDYVYEDEILQRRTEKEIESANKFIQLVLKEEREDDAGKMAVVELLLRTYFLEGVKFPFSFFVTWTINKAYGNAIQGFSQALKLIAWDEMTIHTTTGQNVLKILMSDPDQGFSHLRQKIEEMAYKMAEETARLEFEWNRYLQKKGPIPGYTQQIGEHFIKYWTDYRLKMLGLKPIFNEKKSDVIDWFNNYRNLNRTQVALQEADNTNYQKGTLKNDLDLFDGVQLERIEA
jgi:ribonucleotide reductase beta subunit family protein with ferritin-like domain